MSNHISRAWGNEREVRASGGLDDCTCLVLPCWHVDDEAAGKCPQHAFTSGHTIRAHHPADQCPTPVIRFTQVRCNTCGQIIGALSSPRVVVETRDGTTERRASIALFDAHAPECPGERMMHA